MVDTGDGCDSFCDPHTLKLESIQADLQNRPHSSSYGLWFSCEDLLSQQNSLIVDAPVVEIPGIITEKEGNTFVDLSEYSKNYISTLLLNYDKEVNGNNNGRFTVVLKREYLILLHLSKLRKAQVKYLQDQYAALSKVASKFYSLVLETHGEKRITHISRNEEYKRTPRKMAPIENVENLLKPTFERNANTLYESTSPKTLAAAKTPADLPELLSSEKDDKISNDRDHEIETFKPTSHTSTHSSSDSNETSAELEKSEKRKVSFLRGTKLNTFEEFKQVATQKHFRIVRDLKRNLKRKHQKEIHQVKKVIAEKHNREMQRLRGESAQRSQNYEDYILDVKRLHDFRQKAVESYTQVLKDLEERQESFEAVDNRQSVQNKSCMLTLNKPSLELNDSNSDDNNEIIELDKRIRIKQRELSEIELRIKALGEERDEAVAENSKLVDKANVLMMRNERLKADVQDQASKNEGLERGITHQSERLEDQRRALSALEAKFHNLRIAKVKLEFEIEGTKRRIKHMDSLAKLETQLASSKLVGLVCLLHDHLLDIDVAMKSFAVGHFSRPAFIDTYKLVTFEKDANYFSQLFMESFNKQRLNVQNPSLRYTLSKQVPVTEGQSNNQSEIDPESMYNLTWMNNGDNYALSSPLSNEMEQTNLQISIAQKAAEIKRKKSTNGDKRKLEEQRTEQTHETDDSHCQTGTLQIVSQKNQELYNICTETKERRSLSEVEEQKFDSHNYANIQAVETDFSKYVAKLGIIFENVKFLLNYCIASEQSKRIEMDRLKRLHANEIDELHKKHNVLAKALRLKYQYLQRNCDYFKHENESIILHHQKELEKLKQKYESPKNRKSQEHCYLPMSEPNICNLSVDDISLAMTNACKKNLILELEKLPQEVLSESEDSCEAYAGEEGTCYKGIK